MLPQKSQELGVHIAAQVLHSILQIEKLAAKLPNPLKNRQNGFATIQKTRTRAEHTSK